MDQWYFAEQERPVGPFDLETLREKLRKQEKWSDTLVWREGLSDWQRAGDTRDLQLLPPPNLIQASEAAATTVAPPTSVQKPGSIRKIVSGIALSIIVIISAAFGKVIGKAGYDLFTRATSPSPGDALETGFTAAEAAMRPSLPKRLDEITTLTHMSHVGRTMTYNNTLDLKVDEVDGSARQGLRNLVHQTICNTDEMTKLFRYGAAYRYLYFDPQGKFVTGFVANQESCASQAMGRPVDQVALSGAEIFGK